MAVDTARETRHIGRMLVLEPRLRIKGNPVSIRGCPAAVSENEAHGALIDSQSSTTGGRFAVGKREC
jgi:hypothetical protein